MSVFLSYVFDVPRLTASVKWDWLKIFDLEYVEGYMLRPIGENMRGAEAVRLEMLAKASGLAAEKDTSEGRAGIPELPKRRLTRPISPRLTKPAPRAVRLPEKIPQEVIAGKDPIYMERTSVAQIEAEKEARREAELDKTLQKYANSSAQPFELHETRNTIRAARKEAEQKLASNLMFEAKAAPAVSVRAPTARAEFKMNAAAYLREDALYKRKQADEAKLIQAYESELRDSTEYYRWQTSMREQDLQGRREQVERVRTLAKLSAEEAHLATEKQRRDNAHIAARVKAESAEMQKQVQYEQEMHHLMNEQLVREMAAVRENAPKESQARVLQQRKERRDVIREEMEALLREKEAEEKRELAERVERAKQLKAEHEVHPIPVNVFDPTESIGLGLLDEMSLVEMKERLAINRVRDEEWERDKRGEIVAAKEKQQLNLRKRIENIERVRGAASESNREAREKRIAKEHAEKMKEEAERNTANLALLEALNSQRAATMAERAALVEEEERRRTAQAFGGQGAHATEEAHYFELLLGAEREVTQRQNEAQLAAKIYEETKERGQQAEVVLAKRAGARKASFFSTQAEEIERKRKELVQKEKVEIAVKKEKFLEQREKHKAVKDKIIALNPYANTLTEASKTKREMKQRSLGRQQTGSGGTVERVPLF